MNRIVKRIFYTAGIIALNLSLFAFVAPLDQGKAKNWEIPAKYISMKNPFAGDTSLDRVGKMLYIKHCKSCHGNFGGGDGPKASRLNTNPGNFREDGVSEQSDGVLYYKSIVGRDEMPNYEKKIADEEDRWALINYLRVISKKNKL